jgi:hypothetical protein
MKRIFALLVAVVSVAGLFAQAPQKISYQAVIRDATDNIVANQAIGMKISIMQGDPVPAVVYEETHTPTSNANGLVSLEVGTGTVVSGNFSAINWAAGFCFIKTETDPSGGTNYSIVGTDQILSVPYAIYAQSSGSSGGSGHWTANGNHIYNNNTENVGIGLTNPVRARLEVNGVAGSGLTSAILGGDGAGISFQRDWPTIGFNQYRDSPAGLGKAIASGYGMQMYFNPAAGAYGLDMFNESVAQNVDFTVAPIRALTVFKNGAVQIGSTNLTDEAPFSISAGDNFPSHFGFGSAGHTYIRGGDREHRTIGNFQYRPSKVYINDIDGINTLTGEHYPGGDVIIATGGGSVGIGTENTVGYKLVVNGSIRAKELRINTGWADYVFDDNYTLRSLSEVEAYIKENNHLPDIPAAAILQEEGVDVSDMQTKMMAKIEELTLYMINANKTIETLKERIELLEGKL